jgi:hypothetical protein
MPAGGKSSGLGQINTSFLAARQQRQIQAARLSVCENRLSIWQSFLSFAFWQAQSGPHPEVKRLTSKCGSPGILRNLKLLQYFDISRTPRFQNIFSPFPLRPLSLQKTPADGGGFLLFAFCSLCLALYPLCLALFPLLSLPYSLPSTL